MKYLIIAAVILLASCGGNSPDNYKEVPDGPPAPGENLFFANCSNCHKPAEEYIGPALKGVRSKWPDKELLYDFVRNSQDVISRNKYAKQLFEQYKQSPMTPFPQLKDEEIEAILNYCNTAP